MSRIDYRKIYATNQDEWKALTREPQKYEALLAGHYSDSNHFVYELLQNAEDEKATKVVIEFYKDQLVFYHNGDPFDEDDVRGVSSMLMGTKDRNDAQTIGRFGMGFKSVFKYTYQPEVYSDEEAFIIRNYLLPEESGNAWDYREVKQTLSYPDGGKERYYPFRDSLHLTKIVIPFHKKDENGRLYPVPGQEVLEKLRSLTGEILLFLTDIKDLYWINKNSNEYTHITIGTSEKDDHFVVCRISTSQKKEEITRYLKYKNRFDLDEMQGAEVCVAYRLGPNGKTINAVEEAPVWVYFPTREDTDLPFLIHGSFETAVSREKLMTVSTFNKKLFERLGELIAETMEDLAARELLTQGFIRDILLPAFEDESENETIEGLKEKVTARFKKMPLIPCKNGGYGRVSDVCVPLPFGIAEMDSNALLQELFRKEKRFVALNNERAKNFTEYIGWLLKDLGVSSFELTHLAKQLGQMSLGDAKNMDNAKAALKDIYGFLSDYRESLYERTNYYSYSRMGFYESLISGSVKNAWEILRKIPIILNAEGTLVSAYRGTESNIYLNASSSYKSVAASAIVDGEMAKEFALLFEDGFKIPPFDNLQYVKEKVVKKYISGDTINFENEDFDEEYIEDIRQLLTVFEGRNDLTELMPLISKASILKIETDNGIATFSRPSQTYAWQSDEGIDLKVYFSMPASEEDDDETVSPGIYALDENFYREYGISLKKLTSLGVVTSVVDEGIRSYPGGPGDESWTAMGDFCPRLRIQFFEENLRYIENNSGSSASRAKSAELLKLLLCINQKLSGVVKRRKSNPYFTNNEASQYSRAKQYYSWLYDKDGNLRKVTQMSKFELDTDLYGELLPDKSAYERLGFIETEDDSAAEAFDQVDRLDDKNKRILLRQLAREFGMKVTDAEEDSDEVFDPDNDNAQDEEFHPEAYVSSAFPVSRVRNMESLIEHVRQQFFCADPVKYQKVLRQIRTSKSLKAVKSYAKGMYTNESDMTVCQSCKEPSPLIDVTEIANYGIELPQLHLCLCKNCSARYKAVRDINKEAFRDAIQRALLSLNLEDDTEEYEVGLAEDLSLHFTQTHLAEIQTIFGLLAEYGVPNAEENQQDSDEENVDDDQERPSAYSADANDQSFASEEFSASDSSDDTEIMGDEEENEGSADTSDSIETQNGVPEEAQRGEPRQEPRFDFDNIPVSEPIKDGNLVSYKKLNTLEIVDAVIDSTRYPLHKSFIGKQVGDLVVANGRRYLIVSII